AERSDCCVGADRHRACGMERFQQGRQFGERTRSDVDGIGTRTEFDGDFGHFFALYNWGTLTDLPVSDDFSAAKITASDCIPSSPVQKGFSRPRQARANRPPASTPQESLYLMMGGTGSKLMTPCGFTRPQRTGRPSST